MKHGKEGLQYLQKRTNDNPMFSILTGALHGSRIQYERQQRYLEKIANISPVDLTDEAKNRELLKGAQFSGKRAQALADGSRCYIKHCGVDGEKCKGKNNKMPRYKLMGCLRANARHMGQKTYDLMEEYLGVKNSIAVDRHVMNFICNVEKVCYVGKEKSEHITPKEFQTIKKAVQGIAKAHHMSPAELQVSMWVHEACLSKQRRAKKGTTDVSFYLGENQTIKCCKECKEKV